MDDKEIERLARTCRFELSPAEIEDLKETFRLLEEMTKRMDEVITEDMEEMISPFEGYAVMNSHDPDMPPSKDEVFSNAPKREGDLFSVPARKDS